MSSGQIAIASWVIHKDLYHPIFQVIDQDGTNYGIAPSYNGSFDLGGFRDEVISGVRVTGGSNLARQFINVYGSRAAATADAEQESFNLAAYAENRFFFLPTVALMTGVKVLRENRDYTDHLAPTKSAERTYDGVNPKVGLLWKPSKDIQVFGDVTRSQDVPDFSDLTQAQFGGVVGFVPLQAQHAWTGEIGTRGTYDRFGWDVTAYRSNVRDEFLNFTTNPNIPAATFNAPKTTHQGLELGGNVDLVRDVTGPNAGDRITLRQVWTYSDFAFDNDAVYKNNKIAGVPDNVLRTTLTYAQREGFYASPFVDWVPNGAWVDHANTLQAPGYALVGVETGYDFSNGVSIFFNGRNLGDNHYISDIGTVTNARKVATSVFYPGEGRSVYAGMRVKF